MEDSDKKIAPSKPPAEIGVKWSARLVFKTLFFCLAAATLIIFGFLIYQEYKKQSVTETSLFDKQLTPSNRTYTNDYWGFSFNYLGYWSQVIGSYEDGEYYFSSEPINFIQEQDPDQALMEIRTYNNLQSIPFDQWFSGQTANYFPAATITQQPDFTVQNFQSPRYYFALKRPTATVGFWDMVIVSSNNKKFYMFILETKTKNVHDGFQKDFETMVQSVHLYNGFGD